MFILTKRLLHNLREPSGTAAGPGGPSGPGGPGGPETALKRATDQRTDTRPNEAVAPPPPAPLVEAASAAFGYGGRAVITVDRLRLEPGRCLGVFGPNGSGKTTLLRGLLGLLPPLAGGLRRRRGVRFGYLPQHRVTDAVWPMSGIDAAALATSARRPFGWVGRRAAGRVRETMATLGVADLADRPFAQLSGGQQQRLLLAGALADDPHGIVLDEPTGGLDAASRRALLDALRDATDHRRLAAVVVSHDVQDLIALCDEVVWVHPGPGPDRPAEVELLPPADLPRRLAAGIKE